ncbi:NAD-dependent epimerase/dehydratase family protein [Sphingobacterium hungaricum]|uniref:NAD(P)-dependent oxidoreductase n=1 Tax=Sphingobacterium hungaricum TaxID=2082723 RepID=A0A928UVS2_9SPHI|nr:NAD(P)-dependent oxidoreductase [Sphingobacterium hungaricum]MBE8713617.1 NAD(P)-dependent oxidoreductase [Sphingobacterium hungaricum]
MTKKILITGASGFVGSHLVEAAKSQLFEVHAAVRQSSLKDEIAPFVDKFVYPDWNNSQDLDELLRNEKYDFVIHAAALTKSKSEQEMYTVNVDFTKNLLASVSKLTEKPQRIVFVSSLAAIGPIPFQENQFILNDSPYHPVTVYGRSKRDAELMIKENFADLPITIIRPTAVYGPREKDLFILFDTMNKGFEPYIGRKPQALSFIYVKDLVDVLLLSLRGRETEIVAYNITDGHVYTKYAMADIFKSVFKKRLFRVHIPYGIVEYFSILLQKLYSKSSKTPVIYPERLNELTAENWGCDIEEVKNKLNFEPKYDLESGLKETLEWYKVNKWLS